MRLVEELRVFLRQIRLVLGRSGIAWAAVAGIVGIVCCLGAFAVIALSLHTTDVDQRRQQASAVLELDQSYRALLRSVYRAQNPDIGPEPGDMSVQDALARTRRAHDAICSPPAVATAAETPLLREACAASDEIYRRLTPELAVMDLPRRVVDRGVIREAMTVHARLSQLTMDAVHTADALVQRMASDYERALLVLALCTAGFAGAGLVFILLLGRTSLLHHRESVMAGESRDLLQETIDALPAGIVLYDKDERLVMLNKAVVTLSDGRLDTDSIGKTYTELSHNIVRKMAEQDRVPDWDSEESIRHFRDQDAPVLHQMWDKRWIEWSNKKTASGGTVGLGIDVSELKNRELEAVRARDLLQDTIDALPAGIVLYDKDERLVMFNAMAERNTAGAISAQAIGRTYPELCRETMERYRARGIASGSTPEDWIARFRTKSHRSISPSFDGRWIERFELATSNGGTIGLGVDVTELKNRELELQRSHDVLQETIDAMPAGVVLFDAQERLVMFNKEAASITPSLLKPRAIGSTIAEIVHRSAEEMKAAGIIMTEEPADWIARFRTKNDRQVRPLPDGRWIEWSEKPTANGGTVGLRKDVTELKQHEIAAENARAEYQSLVASLSDTVVKLDIWSGEFTFVSAAAADLLGVAAEQLVGRNVMDFIAREDDEVVAGIARAERKAADFGVRQVQFRMRRADGTLRHVELRFRKTFHDPDGRKTLVTGVLRDVSERVQMAERLESERARLNSIVESSGALILLADRDLKVVMANREFWKVTGLVASETIGRSINDVIDCPLSPEVLARWQNGPLTAELTKPVRYTNNLTDGEGRSHIINVTAKPIVDSERIVRQVVFLGVDDTERRAAEQALYDSERLVTVGEMAGTVAHEIAQPLQVINVASAAMRQELEQADEGGIVPDSSFMAARLDRVDQQVERASRIIGDLRAFVRGSAADTPAPFEPAFAVQGAVDLTRHGLELAGVELSCAVQAGLPVVMGHIGRLEQVLINLINNARDAGARSIGVSAQRIERTGESRVRIVVDDSGPGIPDDVLPRLFNAFVTTKPRGEGTGLGLRICKRIVEEMGGTISARNRPEGGARFEILLPFQSV